MLVATWNMQGAGSVDQNKWLQGVRPLLGSMGVDVLLLQECGARPQNAVNVAFPNNWLGPAPPQNRCTISTYPLRYGRETTNYYLLHFEADLGARRCSLAIVSKQAPAQCFYIPNPLAPAERPVVGIMLQVPTLQGPPVLLGCIHAFSGGGNDGPRFLAATAQRANNGPWFVGGDFNRNPAAAWPNVPPNSTIWRPWQPTQMSGGELDYAWASFPPTRPHATMAQDNYNSDHFPVTFVIE